MTIYTTLHRTLGPEDVANYDAQIVVCPDCGHHEYWAVEELSDHGICRSVQGPCPVCDELLPSGHNCDANTIPHVSDGVLGHGFEWGWFSYDYDNRVWWFECGLCGTFLQAPEWASPYGAVTHQSVASGLETPCSNHP